MKKLIGLLVLASACGGGGKDNTMPDAPPVDTIPAMITITGTASSRGIGGATPQANVTIAAYARSDETTPLATAMTDADGAFTITLVSSGSPVDGFLKASRSGLLTSYLYPPTPIYEDLTKVPMTMLESFDLLEGLTGVIQDPEKALVAVVVVSGTLLTSPPVAGAAIETSPASNPYRYNAANGFPSPDPAETAADGIGYAFNAPVGDMTVTASKSGSTFKSTMIKGYGNALTQTLVIQ